MDMVIRPLNNLAWMKSSVRASVVIDRHAFYNSSNLIRVELLHSKIASSSFRHARNSCDIAATNRTENRAILRFCNFSATKIASSCGNKNRLCKRLGTSLIYVMDLVLFLRPLCRGIYSYLGLKHGL